MRIFHIATARDWRAAQRMGSYTTSTRGRTLAEEGFIHASRGDQWQGVRQRFYADAAEPLAAPGHRHRSTDVAPGRGGRARCAETFPHIYGPLNTDAVVNTVPLDDRSTGGESFSRVFFAELFHNLGLACVVLVGTVLGALAGLAVDDDWGPTRVRGSVSSPASRWHGCFTVDAATESRHTRPATSRHTPTTA